MELKVGFQTILSSSIQCQGMDELLARSMKGIVQNTEYTVTVEKEIFTKNQGHMVARSSSGKLVYNSQSPSLGLLGALIHMLGIRQKHPASSVKQES